MSVSVAFVDDHAILLDGLVSLYSGKKDLHIAARGNNAIDALKIVDEFRPDILVIDLNMPGDAIAAIELILKNYESTKVLVFTATSDIETVVQVLNLGVRGYVLKGCTARDLYDAILAVNGGNTFITPEFATTIILSMRTAELRRKSQFENRLSAREEQILNYLMLGNTNREIARMLDISEKTVKHYMTMLMQKLDARNRVEVVLAAQKLHNIRESEAKASTRTLM